MKKLKLIPRTKPEKGLKVSQKAQNRSKTRKQPSESGSKSIADTARFRVHELLSKGQFKKKKCGKHQFLTFNLGKSSCSLIQLSTNFNEADGKALFETVLFILELKSLLIAKEVGFIQLLEETLTELEVIEEPLLMFHYEPKDVRRSRLIIIDVDNGTNASSPAIDSLLGIIMKVDQEKSYEKLDRFLAIGRGAFQKELFATGDNFSGLVLGGKNLKIGKDNLYRLVNYLRKKKAYSPDTGATTEELQLKLGISGRGLNEFLKSDNTKYKGAKEKIIFRDYSGQIYFLNPSISFE